MALITVSGEPGCRPDEVARHASQRLGFQLVSEAALLGIIHDEFGPAPIPDKAWRPLLASIVARLAVQHHIVVAAASAEAFLTDLPGLLRVYLTAPAKWRAGTFMIDHRLDRTAAKAMLARVEKEQRAVRKQRFGAAAKLSGFDLVFNAATLDAEKIAIVIEAAAFARKMAEQGPLAPEHEAQIQFDSRLQLARHGIVPPRDVKLKRPLFGHPSERVFANLLDFYRIAWEYEPRSFPVQWDRDGKVLEAFTPDFYLTELDLYVELTTMKQANVTRKNRKVKLLKTIYPHINIQVFYQKDFQNLVFKYGLAGRVMQA